MFAANKQESDPDRAHQPLGSAHRQEVEGHYPYVEGQRTDALDAIHTQERATRMT